MHAHGIDIMAACGGGDVNIFSLLSAFLSIL